MTSFKLEALSLGTVISLLSGAAMATASSSATLSNLSVRFIDLDTSDGITPGITFYPVLTDVRGGSYSSALAKTYGHSSYSDEQHSPDNQTFGSTAVAGSSAPGTWVSSSITGGNLVTGPLTLKSAGAASGNRDPDIYAEYAAENSLQGMSFLGFSLTANTLAIFSATADLAASITVGNGSEQSMAQYVMRTHGYSADGHTLQESSNSFAIGGVCRTPTSYPGTGVTLCFPKNELDTVRVEAEITFVNQWDTAINGTFYANTYVRGNSWGAGMVPEPEAPLLALGGACLVAWAKRSRNPRQSGSGR